MTLADFTKIFALLAVQLRFTDADEATARAYFKSLEDVEPEFLAMAAKRLARQVNAEGEAWFPKTGEWRAMAAKVEHERTEELRLRLRKLRTPICAVCGDTGFALNTETNRASRCECQKLRRFEILGRRPMPALPEHEADGDPTHFARVEAAATALASSREVR